LHRQRDALRRPRRSDQQRVEAARGAPAGRPPRRAGPQALAVLHHRVSDARVTPVAAGPPRPSAPIALMPAVLQHEWDLYHATWFTLMGVGGGIFLVARLLRVERARSEEHTSELQSLRHLVCRLL